MLKECLGMVDGVSPRFARILAEETIPFARHLEAEILPNTRRIIAAVERMF